MEDDVLSLIERILQTHLETGEQVRIFSFNERPKKSLMELELYPPAFLK